MLRSRSAIFSFPELFPDLADEGGYPHLTHLKCSICAIDELSKIDAFPPPLSRLSNLRSLNLARNNILNRSTALAGLSSLVNLTKLDLSYNFISEMTDANTMLGNVKVLLLTGNRLTSCRGLDKLYSLEYLAVDENLIKSLSDIAAVAKVRKSRSFNTG